VHPYYTLVRAYDAKQITREEFRQRAELLRLTDPPPEITGLIKHFGPETGVPSAFLAPLVAKHLALLAAEQTPDYWNDECRELLGHRLSLKLGVTVDGGVRIINRILTQETDLVSTIHADAILLELDLAPVNQDLPYIPNHFLGAYEQVDATVGDEMSVDEKRELAHKLYRFSLGMIRGGLLTGDEIDYRRAVNKKAAAAVRVERRTRQKEEALAA
jgi:hypothetical protein